jgi:hypothetical protein
MSQTLNSYDLSRAWFDFCFAHPEKIKPNHTALYFFAIEHCNRLGWKVKFGFPTQMAKDAIGIKSFKTYIETLTDLIEWGFVVMIEKSTNQYSSNIISLVTKFDKKMLKSLDKAIIQHNSKEKRLLKKDESTYQSNSESTYQSIDSIDKQPNKEQPNKEPYYRKFAHLHLRMDEFDKLIREGWDQSQIDDILDRIENYRDNKKYNSLLYTARNWLKKDHKPNSVQKKLTALEIVNQRIDNESAIGNTGS